VGACATGLEIEDATDRRPDVARLLFSGMRIRLDGCSPCFALSISPDAFGRGTAEQQEAETKDAGRMQGTTSMLVVGSEFKTSNSVTTVLV
jgi:hypothetical protein